MKDYYKIMNVPYDATAEDIRKAYHRFAKEYHPDRNTTSSATTLFLDIQEAYYTLSDEKRRQQFHAKTNYPLPGSKQKPDISTTEKLLQQCRALNASLQSGNKHQISPIFIAQTVATILSEKNMEVLLRERKDNLLEEMVKQLLLVMKHLPYRQVVASIYQLFRLARQNTVLQNEVIVFEKRKRKFRLWEKYNVVVVLAATLLLCLLIVLLSE